MRKKKNLILAAAVSAAFLFAGYSTTYADTASLKQAAINGIYLGSDYCDLDGGNDDVATCYYLGKDTADNQYKVIAVRIENNDGLLNNGHGSKLINSTTGINNASAVYVSETLTPDQLTTFGLNGWKSAYRDASNVGANLKKDDDKTAASTEEISANQTAWGNALGSGKIEKGNNDLVKGGTVYDYEAPPSTDEDGEEAEYTYISSSNTTGQNLANLDDQVSNNAGNISSLQNGIGFTQAGDTYIKKLAKDSINIIKGERVTITPSTDADGKVTYTITANNDGKIAAGNTDLVSGDTAYKVIKAESDARSAADEAMQEKINNYFKDNNVATNSALALKANTDASNIGNNLKNSEGGVADVQEQEKNKDAWGEALGGGKVDASSKQLVTGKTMYNELRPVNGTYVKQGQTTAENLTSLDKQVVDNTSEIFKIRSLSNLSDEGKDVIREITKDTVKVKDGEHTIVSTVTDEKTGSLTYKVNVIANGKIAKGDNGPVSGETVKAALDTKADANGSNVAAHAEEWGKALGIGEVKEENTYLVTGDTVYKGVSQMIDDKALVKSDGNTLTIGAKDKAIKIDVHNADGKGRTITGVITDASDSTSAANVGYVDKASEGLMRGMESMRHELKNEIYDSTAKAGAIASLHPQNYDPGDKLEFAAGFGHYHGSNATALGAFYHVNEDVMFNVGATVGAGSPLVTGGVSIKVGLGNSEYKTRGQLKDEIVSLKGENNDLRNEIKTLQKEMAEVRIMLGSIRSTMGVATVPANKYQGDHELTRYEYAEILYKALQKGQKVDYEKVQKYGPELKRIQVDQAARKLKALKEKAASAQKAHK